MPELMVFGKMVRYVSPSLQHRMRQNESENCMEGLERNVKITGLCYSSLARSSDAWERNIR